MDILTAAGAARAQVEAPPKPEFLLVLTHGAGGGVQSKDLLAAGQGGLTAGAVVARILQPYRVRGASAPGSPDRQDAAWLEIIGDLRARYPGLPLVQGGRSNGARVACRTAPAAGALAVIALAFPLHPPGKGGDPERSRVGELRAAGVPVLVISGERDPFGIPGRADADRLVVLPGDTHALSHDPEAITVAVASWLRGLPVLASVARSPEAGVRRNGSPG
jgi:predicted alpha/beta-hydrolase family hydrolase